MWEDGDKNTLIDENNERVVKNKTVRLIIQAHAEGLGSDVNGAKKGYPKLNKVIYAGYNGAP